MEVVEFHFFHGFLGSPQDWRGVQSFLPSQCECISHNLLEDFNLLRSEDKFSEWAHLKELELLKRKGKKILVGYSLGGRLLLHLPTYLSEKVILIASHPGLEEGHEQRLLNDNSWVSKAETLSWQDWLRQWNEQAVFRQDRIRPDRLAEENKKQNWMRLLQDWSLAKQENKDNSIQKNCSSIFWGCGERDENYKSLIARMESFLSKEHIFQIPNSGHGVLFDEPKRLAGEIQRIAFDV